MESTESRNAAEPQPMGTRTAPSRRDAANSRRKNVLQPRMRRGFQFSLQRWYAENARDLPWRRTSDPYHIWVSEVMLQQTQVSTVVPYYQRFLDRFPTLESLAAASQHDVLKLWQGLGYYRRAINLHQAAREVMERHDGEVPADLGSLRQLPGVGRYIAGAILSFAFNRPAPVLEANTSRVLCRLFAVRGADGDGDRARRLWDLAEALLPQREPGLHNQALMELGALVCLPRRPRCDECPVNQYCEARAQGLIEQLPEARRRPQPVDVCDAAAVLWRRGRLLIVRRPPQERWGGLWELPRTTVAEGKDPRTALRTHVRRSLALDIDLGPELLVVKHGVTHHRITLHCYEATRVVGRARPNGYAECRWELPACLGDYAFSSPQRRLITAIQQGRTASEAG